MLSFFGWRPGRTTATTLPGELRPGLEAHAMEAGATAENVGAGAGFSWANAGLEDSLSTFFIDDIENLSTISDCGQKAPDEPHDDGHIVPPGEYPRSNGTDVELSSVSSEISQGWKSNCSKRERASVSSCSTRATTILSVSSAFSVRDNRYESDNHEAFAISSRTIEASHSKLEAHAIGYKSTIETVCAGISTLDQHKRTRLHEGEQCLAPSPLQWSL
eukprot:TRINITY_DN16338_c1_g3_i4.p1 TRINITY_DN16338_c1_g3~~TRINITY_DN16338_c1_g3_i4.p1  ORF type:complete len:230 (+),score=27.08 TRINITY_DN16338_c1_g3_i4:38-691(+)